MKKSVTQHTSSGNARAARSRAAVETVEIRARLLTLVLREREVLRRRGAKAELRALDETLSKILPTERQIRDHLPGLRSARLTNLVGVTEDALRLIEQEGLPLAAFETARPRALPILAAHLACSLDSARSALSSVMTGKGTFLGGRREAALAIVGRIEGTTGDTIRRHLGGDEDAVLDAALSGMARIVKSKALTVDDLAEWLATMLGTEHLSDDDEPVTVGQKTITVRDLKAIFAEPEAARRIVDALAASISENY